ncbi:MAG: type II toxin-antitoxin system PemK/MazF family toxin [Alphaproteobacteria bacterium]
MKRGEVWTAAASGYVGKPRPVIIVQDDGFSETDSITVCPATSDPGPMPLFRVEVEPNAQNGLVQVSRLMADKLLTVPRGRLGRRIGRLDDATMLRLDRAITVFLGLAS